MPRRVRDGAPVIDPDDALLRPPRPAPAGKGTGVHRGSADGWVECGCGARHWGRAGAAGLLAWRIADGRVEVALQHRAWWSHHGGTWGIPGGAIEWEETPVVGALRESGEEVGLGAADVAVHATVVLRHPDWSYTTVPGEATGDATPHPTDAESLDARWVDAELVDAAVAAGHVGAPDARPGTADAEARLAATRARRDAMRAGPELVLLPAFAEAWPALRPMLERVVLVVDGANTVGSRPDGWWRDRAGALARLAGQLAAASDPTRVDPGLPAETFGSPGPPGARRVPDVILVAEGRARGVVTPSGGRVRIVDADASGDDEIVAQARHAAGADARTRVLVVTADRALRARCREVGAEAVGPGALLAGLAER